jgi:hypothetical protein
MMSHDRPTRETMSLEEATGSYTWEIAAIVEVLDRKGILPKEASQCQTLHLRLRHKRPRSASYMPIALAEQQLMPTEG